MSFFVNPISANFSNFLEKFFNLLNIFVFGLELRV